MGRGLKVSVIVPTRNRPDALRVALDGIASQTHPLIELVLIDDGSSPDNAARNQTLAREMMPVVCYRYLDAARGSGPSAARNQGLALATGELIAFLDDDDIWTDPGHLAEAVKFFEAEADLDLVFANQEDHLDGKPVFRTRLPRLAKRLGLGDERTGRSFRLRKDDCLLGYHACLNTCVYRRTVLEAIGGFWEAIRYAEDCDLYARSIDVARGVRYRDWTIGIHPVADESLRATASTVLDEEAKQLACVYISQHLIQTAQDPAVIRFARELGGNAYRRLALVAHREGQPARAAEFARLALAALYSTKWAVFTVYSVMRRMLSRSR